MQNIDGSHLKEFWESMDEIKFKMHLVFEPCYLSIALFLLLIK